MGGCQKWINHPSKERKKNVEVFSGLFKGMKGRNGGEEKIRSCQLREGKGVKKGLLNNGGEKKEGGGGKADTTQKARENLILSVLEIAKRTI